MDITEYLMQNTEMVAISLAGLFFVISVIFIARERSLAKRTRSLQKMVDEMDHDKAEMYSKLKTLEEENKNFKDKLSGMETGYFDKVRSVDEKEKSLVKSSREVEDRLLKLRAMEETIEMQRTKIGVLETEKRDLQARLDNISIDQQRELSTEKEKLETLKRELKDKTKETVTKVMAENEELKKKIETLKERLALWESVKDL